MKHIIEINDNICGYYISVNGMSGDSDIIDYLGITKEFYFNKGIELKGQIKDGALYFKIKTNALIFLYWLKKHIDSFLVAKKLTGSI